MRYESNAEPESSTKNINCIGYSHCKEPFHESRDSMIQMYCTYQHKNPNGVIKKYSCRRGRQRIPQ